MGEEYYKPLQEVGIHVYKEAKYMWYRAMPTEHSIANNAGTWTKQDKQVRRIKSSLYSKCLKEHWH